MHDVINSNDRSLGTPGQGLFVPILLKSGGLEQGRRAGRKADGTLDKRLKANRAGRGGEAGGEDGEGDGCSGGGGALQDPNPWAKPWHCSLLWPKPWWCLGGI